MFLPIRIYPSGVCRMDYISFGVGLIVYCAVRLAGPRVSNIHSVPTSLVYIPANAGNHWYIATLADMTDKLRFPAHTIFGHFLNDYLSGRDLVKLYSPYSTGVEHDGNITILELAGMSGVLFINYHQGYISWVACDIDDLVTIDHLMTFVVDNMKIVLNGESSQTYTHESGVTFAFTKHVAEGQPTRTLACCRMG